MYDEQIEQIEELERFEKLAQIEELWLNYEDDEERFEELNFNHYEEVS